MTRRTETSSPNANSRVAFSCLLLTKSLQPRMSKTPQLLEMSRSYASQHGLKLNEKMRFGKPSSGVVEIIGELAAVAKRQVASGSVLLLDYVPLRSDQAPAVADAIMDVIRAGIEVHNLHDGRIYKSETQLPKRDDLMATLLSMGLDFEESQKRSERASQAWNQKRQQPTGEPITKRLPGWLRWDNATEKIVTIPDRAKTIEHIFQLAQAGVSKRDIAHTFQGEQIPCWGQTGRWTPSYINKLLTSPAVVGDYLPHASEGGQRVPTGEVRSGYYPAIIGRDQWDYVQQLRAGNPRGRTATSRVNNLFPGLLWHGETGKRMTVIAKGKPEWTYLAGDPPPGKSDERTYLNYGKFEHLFLEFTGQLDWAALCKNLTGIESNTHNEPSRKMAKSKFRANIAQVKKLVAEGVEPARVELREHIKLLVERIDIHPHGLQKISHLENTEGYPVYRVKFRTGAVKYILTDDGGELVAVLDEPQTNRKK